jgi:methionine synthase I (cobalamin-dependent)
MSNDPAARIRAAAARRILVLDGAMGTMIQKLKLTEEDFRGDRFRDWPRDLKGNNDLLILTQPAAIEAIHRQYFELRPAASVLWPGPLGRPTAPPRSRRT